MNICVFSPSLQCFRLPFVSVAVVVNAILFLL